MIALIATFFIPTAAHALTNQNTCNPSSDKANPSVLGQAQSSCIGDVGFGSSHWYKFEFSSPTAFGLRFDRGGNRAKFFKGTSTVAPSVGPSAGDLDQAEWHYRLPAGAYLLEIRGPNTNDFDSSPTGFYGDYSFTYEYMSQNDCGSFNDAGNSVTTAATGTSTNSCTGAIWGSEFHSGEYRDTEDWYRFALNQGETFVAYLAAYTDPTDGCATGAAGICGDILTHTLTMDLLDAKGKPIAEVPPATALSPINFPVLKTDTYFLKISGTVDDIYSLTTAVSAIPNTNGLVPDTSNLLGNDQCAAPDAGGNSNGASQLQEPSDFSPVSCYGFLGNTETDVEDWYKFQVSDAEFGSRIMSFELDSESSLAFEIRDPGGALFTSSNGGTTLGIPVYSTTVPLSRNGVYKLRLFNPFGQAVARYQFLLDVRNNIATLPSIPPSLPPIGVEALNQDSCAAPGNVDTGNDKKHASTFFNPTGYCYGALGKTTNDNQDWYIFSAAKDQRFSFMLSGDGLSDPNITLFRPNGTTFPNVLSQAGAVPEYAFQTVLDAAGTWAIRISQGNPSPGNYVLLYDWRGEITSVPGIPPTIPNNIVPTVPNLGVNMLTDDCSQAGDAPNTKPKTHVTKQPTRRVPNQTACPASLGLTHANDTIDWYSFTGKTGQTVIVSAAGDGILDPTLNLYTPTGARVASFPNQGAVPDYIRHDMTRTGTYFVSITRAGNNSGHYGLFVDVPNEVNGVPFVPQTIPATPSVNLTGDCGAAGDAPNSKPRTHPTKQPARNFTPNSACMASLGGADGDDWYQFGATAGQHFSLGISPDYTLDPIVMLVDPRGAVRVISGNGGVVPETFQNYLIDRTGVWKFRVLRASGTGNYYMSSSLGNY